MFGRKRRSDADFSEELKSHLALEADRLADEGLSQQDARWQANRVLGNVSAAEERFFEASRWMWLEQLWQDTRLVLRRLRQAPVFALTAIVTIALGIGATTSIFTLAHAVLLRSLAVSKPGELYRLGREVHCCVWGGYSQYKEFSIVSYGLYRHLRDHTPGFAELAAFSAGEPMFGVRRAHSTDAARSYPGEFVSGNYFTMFGVNAYAGRILLNSDDQPDAPPVAVMSYRLLREKYGLDPTVIGGVFHLNEKPFTVVGIAPGAFYGDSLRETPPDFFLPLATEPLVQGENSFLRHETTHWLDLIGRIRPGANPTTIQAGMRVALQQWLRSHWGDMNAGERSGLPEQTLYLSPGGSGITGMRNVYEKWLDVLMMVTGFVLLLVCANVANLMLVRGIERRQQTSLSMALGARSGRLVRQALTESVVLALIGGAAGVGVAFIGTDLILRAVFPAFAGLGSVSISASPSLPVLAFAFAVALLTGMLFGAAPAWIITRIDPIEALRGSHRATRRAGSVSRKAMVAAQTALALVLLSASGLLTAALRHLEHQDFGFEQDRRTIVNIDPSLAGYRANQLNGLYQRVHDAMASLPGVESVAICIYSPESGDSWNDGVYVEGRPAPGQHDDTLSSWNRVTAGYFDTIGTPIVKGRPITEQDTATSPRVAVVSEAFARKFFKNENPIGKHFGRTDITTSRQFEIVGVAKDAQYLPYTIGQPPGAFFFVPEPQYAVFPRADSKLGEVGSHYLHDVVVRMKPGAILTDDEARRAVAGVDPNLPVLFVRSLREQLAATFGPQRLIARLTSLFGLLSLLLASLGIYGVTAFNASSRTSEIGVRMALGAHRGHILTLVLSGALGLIGAGLLLGAPLVYAAGRFLASQLFGTNPYDPAVLAIAAAAISLSAFVAALIPALRASGVSPVQALRTE